MGSLVSILSMNSSGVLSGIVVSISHGFSSSSLFLLAGLLISKTYSRYLDSFFFINTQLRGLLVLLLLATISFPGTFNFVGEIISFIAIFSMDWFLIYLFFFLSTGRPFLVSETMYPGGTA